MAFTVGVLLWCIYGFINGQASIVAANGITLALASIILGMKIRAIVNGLCDGDSDR